MFLGLNFISYRLRSKKEVVDYLKKNVEKKKYPPELGEEVLSRLEELGYIDDQKFAEVLVASRRGGKKKGFGAIQRELKVKGVSEAIIAAVLGQQDKESELALARAASARKALLWQKLPLLSCKRKAYDFLLRRGFSSSVAMTLVDEICKNAYNTSSEI